MREALVFDRYETINESRKDFLEQSLAELVETYDLRTALDVGCGVGFFSNCLAGMGMDVVALDARAENVAEATKRYPSVTFLVRNLEDPHVLDVGSAQLVLCFGLLYHLENPFLAIRNLFELTKKIMIIESMISPHQLPVAALIDEKHQEDQSLHYVAFVPSEASLVKMLYRVGFAAVYKPNRLPEHPDFRGSLAYRRRRTILVASKVTLTSPTLRQLTEPRVANMWQRNWAHQAERFLRFLRRPPRAKLLVLRYFAKLWHRL